MKYKKLPRINNTPPHTIAESFIDLDEKYVSPSYTRSYPLVARSAEGMWLQDVDGNEFLDFTAGIGVCSTGHCHPKVVAAIKNQAEKLIHMSGTDFYYGPQIHLANKLAHLMPRHMDYKVYFGNSGAEAVEAAFKLARWHTHKPINIAFTGAFHGRTMGALSLTGRSYIQKEHYYPLVPQVFHVPYAYCYRCHYNLKYPDCGIACAKYIEEELFNTIVPPSQVSAIFVEPIQGEGGYIVPPKEFMSILSRTCKDHDILLVADEVQAGMGRTGKMFAMNHFNIEPDIITLAKGIASGMPLGAVIAPAHIMKWPPGSHASTFGGNPISCEAALVTIDLLERQLIHNAEIQGRRLRMGLRKLQEDFEFIGDIRGKGLMVGMEIVRDRETKEVWPRMRDKIIDSAFYMGLLLLGCGPSSVRFSPPLVVNSEEVDICIEILNDIFKEL